MVEFISLTGNGRNSKFDQIRSNLTDLNLKKKQQNLLPDFSIAFYFCYAIQHISVIARYNQNKENGWPKLLVLPYSTEPHSRSFLKYKKTCIDGECSRNHKNKSSKLKQKSSSGSNPYSTFRLSPEGPDPKHH